MRRQQGFTIIELMIVVVVIAVLSAIALPSYTDYITRSKIAEAYAHLADLRAEGLLGIAFTVDTSNAKQTVVTAATPMASKGYASAGTCWVRKKPSQC
jgi:prepilin-type N-terminal cleavage/methylation domain-containing protein